ncbi:MAG: hypothetical protein AAFQ82_24330, partial [Myxococcota bacterium]
KGQSLRQQKLVQTIRMMRLGDDPNAFVQRVMRESYALGNERMREFADRLKKANELRKAIRKEAARVREALSQHAGREPTDALLSPVKMMDVDSARMELVDAFRTLETAGEADADIDQSMSQNAEGSRAPWDKEDGLSAGERANLKLWSQDDDYIKENLDEIRSMADRLSVDEFDRHFFPILARLAADDEEEEILDLLGALPAHLRLRAVTREIGQAPRPNWERASGASAYTQSASVGPSVTSEFFGRFDQKWLRRTIREALTGRESRDYERLRNEALDELSHSSGLEMHELWMNDGASAALDAWEKSQLPEAIAPEQEPEAAATTVGGEPSQAVATTVSELQSYEKTLEEQLNSVGEDAQLMNVDLQSQLQKQQQLLQMMSNMSKQLHDAAMSIVRKLEG